MVGNSLAALLAALMLTAFGTVWFRLRGRSGWRAQTPAAVLCMTQMLWFVAPWLASLVGGTTVPSVYYATGALAFMHCAQYLWVTAYYTRAQAARVAAWNPWRYASVLILGGIALFLPGPWIASSLANVDLRESLIIFTAIVNLHHFMLDGALWKLRDRGVAAVLIDGRPADQATPAPLVTPLRPGLRWTLAGALLAVAAVDGSQRALTRETATRATLALAQRLNPHDTRVDVRLATLLARTARDDAAIAVLRPLVATNPMHAPAQRLLGSLLVAGQRWEEAADCYQNLALRGGLDAGGYVNLGVLRVRARDLSGAESAFRRALALDPNSADAHLNLAETMWEQGRVAEAVGGYERYLVLADPRDVPGQRFYLLAALKLAEAQSRAGNAAAAAALLQRTIRAAEHIDAKDLLAAAHAQAARLTDRAPASAPAAP
jgi:Flp pilus assembly protein TadD